MCNFCVAALRTGALKKANSLIYALIYCFNIINSDRSVSP